MLKITRLFQKKSLKFLSLISISIVFLIALVLVNFSFIKPSEKSSDLKESSTTVTSLANLYESEVLEKHPDAVEVLEKRTENSKTYLIESDNSGAPRYALSSSTRPIHYEKDGVWQEIDTALLPTFGDWDYSMEKAGYSFYAKENFTAENLVEFRRNGDYVRFSPESLSLSSGNEREIVALPQDVRANVEGSKISWSGAFGEGTELFWKAEPTELLKLLKVVDLSKLLGEYQNVNEDNYKYLNLSLKFNYSNGVEAFINGKKWEGDLVNTKGEIEFRDTDGDFLWKFAKPAAWDAQGTKATGNQFIVEKSGEDLLITHQIPLEWLAYAKYPIFIDVDTSSTKVNTNGRDGYIIENGCGAGCHSWVPGNTYLYSGASTAGKYHGWAYFPNISGLGGARITLAYYRVHGQGNFGSAKTKISAERTASPSTPTTGANYLSKTLTTNKITWNGTLTLSQYNDSPLISNVIQELVDNFNPGAIQIMHKDDGSATTSLNAMQYRSFESGGTTTSPWLYIEYDPAPDLQICRAPVFTFTCQDSSTIIAKKYPQVNSSDGSTVQTQPNWKIGTRGWIVNFGGAIPASKFNTVKLCVVPKTSSVPGNCGTSPQVNAGWPNGGTSWNYYGAVPFGTYCADVSGDGTVDIFNDMFAIAGKVGTPYDPNFDTDDDGDVDNTDVNNASNQAGMFCTRNTSMSPITPLGFTNDPPPPAPGTLKAHALVDPTNVVNNESNESNNYGVDNYLVYEPGSFATTMSPIDIALEKTDPPSLSNVSNISFTWLPASSNWKDDATVNIVVSGLPNGMSASFNSPGSNVSTLNTTKSAVASGVPLYFATSNTATGTYATNGSPPINITVTVSQTNPNQTVVYNAPHDPRIPPLLQPWLSIHVRENNGWYKSRDGDVASLGKIENKFDGTTGVFNPNGADSVFLDHPQDSFHNVVKFTGQPYQVGIFCTPSPDIVHRSYLIFDTSPVPDSQVLEKAELVFEVQNVERITSDFDVDILRKNWTGQASDSTWHAAASPSGAIGEFQARTSPTWINGQTISVDITNHSAINKTGETRLEIKKRNESTGPCTSIVQNRMVLSTNVRLRLTYYDSADFNSDYLAIANGAVDPFRSLKEWVVPNYAPPGGLNTGFGNFSNIYNDFRASLSDKWNGVPQMSWPTTSGIYHVARSIFMGQCDCDLDFTGGPSQPITPNTEMIIFVNGDLTIAANLDLKSINSRIIFIVSGNPTNGNNFDGVAISAGVDKVDGYFITSSEFRTRASAFLIPPVNCNTSTTCKQLELNGAVIANNIKLYRDLGNTNADTPAELFKYDPSYLYYFARKHPTLNYSLIGDQGQNFEEVDP